MNRLCIALCVVLFLVSSLAQAQEVCDIPQVEDSGTVIVFGNGMNKLRQDSKDLLDELRDRVQARLPADQFEKLEFELSYNRTRGLFIDFLEASKDKFLTEGIGGGLIDFYGAFWRAISHVVILPDWFQEVTLSFGEQIDSLSLVNDIDLQNHLILYSESIVAGKKVVLVSHSQGNFFANRAYELLYSGEDTLNTDSFGIVAVATPASFVGGDGPYTTLTNDRVIQGVRAFAERSNGLIDPPKKANRTNSADAEHDLLHHGFIKTYLVSETLSEEKILNDVEAVMNSLQDPNDLLDSDGDGVINSEDAFPLDDSEWLDSDGDCVGDNADAFPFDPDETIDSDGDGIGDNSDPCPFDETNNCVDSDGDGFPDGDDAFPDDPNEWLDSDGDGVGDNADDCPFDPNGSSDPDGDGVCVSIYVNLVVFDVQASVYSVFADEAATKDITITAQASSASPFGMRVAGIDGLVGATGESYTAMMNDDGIDGDEVSGDGKWTVSLPVSLTEPATLRIHDGKADFVTFVVEAVDTAGDVIPNYTTLVTDKISVGIVDRSEHVGVTLTSNPRVTATDAMVSVVDPSITSVLLGDMDRVTRIVYSLYPDVFDFIVISRADETGEETGGTFALVQNDVLGINRGTIWNSFGNYGSSGKLQFVLSIQRVGVCIGCLRLLAHRFGAFLNRDILNLSKPGFGDDGFGKGIGWAVSDHKGQLNAGPDLADNDNGGYVARKINDLGTYFHLDYSPLELYLFGLAESSEVFPMRFVTDPSVDTSEGSLIAENQTRIVTIDDIVAVYGLRTPTPATSQKSFRTLFVKVSDRPLTDAEYTLSSVVARYYAGSSPGGGLVSGAVGGVPVPPSFSSATGFRATMVTTVPESL